MRDTVATLLADATPQQLLATLLNKDKALAEEFNTALTHRQEFAQESIRVRYAEDERHRVSRSQDAITYLTWGKQAERRVIDRCLEILCSW